MNRRRSFPWAWVLLTILLVVVVGAIAYYAGSHVANPTVIGPMRPPFRTFAYHPGIFGLGLGSWLILLVVALLVGLLVAAIIRPSRSETFEDWHRRVHEQGSSEHGPSQSPPPPSSGPGSSTG